MKKKTLANLIMVAVILAIFAAGILAVGYIRGWFDTAGGAGAMLTDIRGIVQIRRGGVEYPAENDTVLRSGDVITTGSGATAFVRIGEDYIVLGGSTKLTVSNPAARELQLEVGSGEVFLHIQESAALTFAQQTVTFTETTAGVSVRSGAQTIHVFRGAVNDAKAGQSIEYVDGEMTVNTVALSGLNDFTLNQIRLANETASLCFSNKELDELDEKRQQALQDLINGLQPSTPVESQPTESTEATQPPTETTAPTQTEETTEPTQTEEPTVTQPPQTEVTTPPVVQAPAGSCYITIRCETILQNMDALDPGKAEFVPVDGIILPVVQVTFYKDETVFDVLRRVCEAASIQLEYSWTPLYDSYYVEGINNLYEFDCGYESGWMYKVNEWFPNYGCSSYEVKDGDVIVWCYTCKGLGTDVGAERME